MKRTLSLLSSVVSFQFGKPNLIRLFAVVFMLFAQAEGTFDDIPQTIGLLSKAVLISDPSITDSVASDDDVSSRIAILTETDDEDEILPRTGFAPDMYDFYANVNYLSRRFPRHNLIESGSRKDKSPPAKLA